MTHPQIHKHIDKELQPLCGKVQAVTLCFMYILIWVCCARTDQLSLSEPGR